MIFGNLEYGLATVGKTLDKLSVIGNYDFGKLYKSYDINMSDFKAFSATEINSLQEYVNALNKGSVSTKEFNEIFKGMREEVVLAADGFTKLKLATDTGAVSEGEYAVATQNLALTQKTATATSKALATALNLITNIAMTVAISLAIKGLSALVDKLVVTREELEELRNEAVESSERLKKSAETFVEEAQSIDELLQKYQQIHANVSDTSQAKDELLQVQEDLIDKFGKEAEGLDLINGKYDENIAKVKEYTREKYNEWKTENAAEIRRAEKVAGYNFDVTRDDSSNVYRRDTKIGRNRIKEIYGNDELAQSLFVIKDVSADIRQIYEDIEGLDMSYGDLLLGGDINAAIDSLSKLINYYKDLGNADEETLRQLTDHLKSLKAESSNIDYYLNNVSSVGNVFESVKSVVVNAFDDMAKIGQVSGDEMRTKWLENLDEMQKGSLKNISTMVSALQDLSEGKGIAANTFWQLVEFDEQGLLNGAKLVGDKFIVTEENMIKLKDQYIQKQIESIKLRQAEHEEAYQTYLNEVKTNEQKLRELPLTDKMYNTEAYRKINQQLETARANAKAYGDDIERDRWLIEYLNQSLGNTVEQQEAALKAAQDYADNLLKAQEYKIDQIISGHEAEKDALEAEKEALQDELDILNDQKDAIEEIISNYDTVNNLVQKTVEKEIDSLEEQKQAIEDTYNARIDALKAENEERSDALEYAEKLANLENAKKNKRRVYDETRGWRYESVKEDVKKAENELAEFQTSQEIKKLEKERDELTKGIDDQIDSYKDYEDIWKEIAEEIQTEEDELLAEQILGADWREKIAQKDTAVMDKFRSEYRNHNVALNNLTNTEIKLKEAAIEAKDAEIKSKEEQIKIWKAYKTEVQTAAKDIKDATEGYIELLDTVTINETSDLQTRTENLNNFKNAYSGALQTAIDLQNQLDNNGGEINYDVHVNGLDELKQAAAAATVIATTAGMTGVGGAMVGVGGVMAIANSPILQSADDIADTVKDILNRIGLYSSGGIADYTGLAMLHGRKNAPEVIFNASDSAKLYELVHGTPNLMADMIDKATKLSQFNMAKVGSTTNTSSVNIDSINVYANNPAELSRGLDKELDRYFQTKLTQNYTSRS